MSSSLNSYSQAREALGLTKVALAREIPCSRSAVLYNEQGLYVAPIEVVTEFFVAHGFDRETLLKGYRAFQRSQRRTHERMWLLPPVDLSREPLREAIRHNGFTPTRFCKMFCLQPVLLHQPKSMGPYVKKVFLSAGFTPVQIEELDERLKEYIDHVAFRHGYSDSDVH